MHSRATAGLRGNARHGERAAAGALAAVRATAVTGPHATGPVTRGLADHTVPATGPVTGGTGSFAGATGTITGTPVTKKKEAITITYSS